VKFARAVSTFAKSAALRLGSAAAGRGLLADFASEDETVRSLAGMFLVRNGDRSLPILREALARRQQMPAVLTMLGDIATDDSAELIRQYTGDPDPEVGAAARAALDILERNRSRPSKP
jgi:HEAT repeat protein